MSNELELLLLLVISVFGVLIYILYNRIIYIETRYNSDIQKIAAWQNEQTAINKALVEALDKPTKPVPIQYEWGKA